jgi:DNA replication initiation complex subunit (GINS family)
MYSELYAAWQREIDDPVLQPLPADFYSQVSDYIRRINEETRALDKKAIKGVLLEQELKNVKRIVKQLIWLRYKKLVKLVQKGQKLPSDLLTAEEAQLSKGYLPFVEGYRAFAQTLLQGQPQKTSLEKPVEQPVELPQKRVTLRFVKAIPAVMGGDMKTYGPFAPEDVASVPVENAKILVKQGFAVVVDVP